jgi:hypothetical protein
MSSAAIAGSVGKAVNRQETMRSPARTRNLSSAVRQGLRIMGWAGPQAGTIDRRADLQKSWT